jgi:hypothetical protein
MATTVVNIGRRSRAGLVRRTAFVTEVNVSGSPASYDSIPAPGTGKRVVIMAVALSANATVTVEFRSDTDVVGQRPSSVNAPILADGGDYGLVELGTNKKLVIGLNANALVSGWITYVIEDVP